MRELQNPVGSFRNFCGFPEFVWITGQGRSQEFLLVRYKICYRQKHIIFLGIKVVVPQNGLSMIYLAFN